MGGYDFPFIEMVSSEVSTRLSAVVMLTLESSSRLESSSPDRVISSLLISSNNLVGLVLITKSFQSFG